MVAPPTHIDRDLPSQMLLHTLNACVQCILQDTSGTSFAMFAVWKGFQLHGFGRRALIWCLACVRIFSRIHKPLALNVTRFGMQI